MLEPPRERGPTMSVDSSSLSIAGDQAHRICRVEVLSEAATTRRVAREEGLRA